MVLPVSEFVSVCTMGCIVADVAKVADLLHVRRGQRWLIRSRRGQRSRDQPEAMARTNLGMSKENFRFILEVMMELPRASEALTATAVAEAVGWAWGGGGA